MKRILVTTLVACALVSSVLAQGTVTFSAPVGNVKYLPAGGSATAVPVGNPAQIPGGFGKLNISAYYNTDVNANLILLPSGVPDLTGWSMSSTVLSRIFPGAGAVIASDFTLGVAPGTPVKMAIVAWSGASANFPAAVTDGGLLAWTGDKNSGGMLGWTQATGGGTAPGAALTTGAYSSLVLAPIPEPSTFALAGLGAAALLIFRRRK